MPLENLANWSTFVCFFATDGSDSNGETEHIQTAAPKTPAEGKRGFLSTTSYFKLQ